MADLSSHKKDIYSCFIDDLTSFIHGIDSKMSNEFLPMDKTLSKLMDNSFIKPGFPKVESKRISINSCSKNDQDSNFLWTSEDQNILSTLVQVYKYDWKKITKKYCILTLSNRKSDFLRARYQEIKKPSTKKLFSHEEDLKIAEGIAIHGLDWSRVAELLPQRDAIMVKNRYYSHIRKFDRLDHLLAELDILI